MADAKNRMNEKTKKVMDSGSFGALLLNLSVPSVLAILVMIIYNIADTFFIGQTGNPDMMAAITLSMPLFTILSGLGTLFGNGGTTTLSIALGRGDSDKVEKIMAFCALGVLVIGFGFFILIFFFTAPIAKLLGADEATLEYTVTYMRVFSFTGPFTMFSQIFGSIMRADGDGKSSMMGSFIGTLSNIFLDALFILGFHWNVFGAAFATVIGNVISSAIVLVIILRKKQAMIPNLRKLDLNPAVIGPVITLGLPMTCSTLLSSVSGTVQNNLMMSYSSVALSAQSVAGKVNMIITMLIMGFAMGISPAISYNYGKKNLERMNRITKNMLIFCTVLGCALTVLIFIFRRQLVAAFIDNDEVIAYGQVFVLAGVLCGPVYGVYQMCQTFMQATGKSTYAIFTSLLDKGIIYLPILFILNYLFGAYGIAFAHALTLVFSIIVAVALTLKWKKEMGD